MSPAQAPFSLHRGYLPGAIGRITERHARYYREAAGFGLDFECKVARELGEFCARSDPARDGLWLALRAAVQAANRPL
jgi:hypothetical protein